MNGLTVALVLILTVLVAYFAIKKNQCSSGLQENYGYSALSGVQFYNKPCRRYGGSMGDTPYYTTNGYVLM